jgi:hypothetical protein
MDARIKSGHDKRVSRRAAPEFCSNLPAPALEGAGNAGRAMRTRSLACKIE